MWERPWRHAWHERNSGGEGSDTGVRQPGGAPVSGVAEQAKDDYGALTGEQQTLLDHAAAERGVSVVQLMEVAGWQVARWIFRSLGGQPAPLLVVAGQGNNGGDGLVAARHLWTWGFPVEVALVADPDRLVEVVAGQLGAARGLDIPVAVVPGGEVPAATLDRARLVVDAILGTGLRGDPRPRQAEAISRLPSDRTVSIDVPSGLDAGAGVAGAPTVRALRTCTLTAMKSGLWTPTGRRHAGEVTVADIGMPRAAWAAVGLRSPRLVTGGELVPVPDQLLTGATET